MTGGAVTAKDFRTLRGTILAADALARIGPASTKTDRKRAEVLAVKAAAEALGNTPPVAKSSYIDPRVFARYRKGIAARHVGVARIGDPHPAPRLIAPYPAHMVQRAWFSPAVLLLVIAGGAIGVAVRAVIVVPLGDVANPLVVPVVTLAVNLLGAFTLGVIVGRLDDHHPQRAFLGTGVMGGFTTYSAFAVQSVTVSSASPLIGLLLIAVSLFGGVVAAAAGLQQPGARPHPPPRAPSRRRAPNERPGVGRAHRGRRHRCGRALPARRRHHSREEGVLPLGILVVNIVGSFLLGLLAGVPQVSPAWLAIIGTGVLGGFTTFSTVAVETVLLAQRRRRDWAWVNLLGTFLVCLVAAAVGLHNRGSSRAERARRHADACDNGIRYISVSNLAPATPQRLSMLTSRRLESEEPGAHRPRHDRRGDLRRAGPHEPQAGARPRRSSSRSCRSSPPTRVRRPTS